jgi:hypothetical protein
MRSASAIARLPARCDGHPGDQPSGGWQLLIFAKESSLLSPVSLPSKGGSPQANTYLAHDQAPSLNFRALLSSRLVDFLEEPDNCRTSPDALQWYRLRLTICPAQSVRLFIRKRCEASFVLSVYCHAAAEPASRGSLANPASNAASQMQPSHGHCFSSSSRRRVCTTS